MKTKVLFSIVLLGLIMSSNCNIDEYLKNKRIEVDLPSYTIHVVLEFLDVQSDAYVVGSSGEQVTGRFSEVGSGILLNYLDQALTTFTAHEGVFSFTVDTDQNPTAENPISFLMNSVIAGYEPVSRWIRLTGDGIYTFRVPMYQVSNPPDGVDIVTDAHAGDTDGTGQLLSPIKMQIGTKAGLEIPDGAILKDASGNSLTGQVALSATFFDPASEDAMRVFPGGFDVRTNKSGQLTDGSFATSGLFNIDLTVGGVEVKTLENGGVQIRNEVSGEPGTSVDLWSYDEGTGSWLYEQTGEIAVVDGKKILEATLTHLSDWNWDYFANSCEQGITLKFIPANNNIETTSISIYGKGYAADGGFFQKTLYYTYDPQQTSEIKLIWVPGNVPTTFTFTAPYNQTTTFDPPQLTVPDLCSTSIYEITVGNSVSNPTIALTFDIGIVCPGNDQVVLKPSFLLWYKSINNSGWYYRNMTQGLITLNLSPGLWYDAAATFSNNMYRQTRFMVEQQGDEIWVHHVEFFMAESAGSYEFTITKFTKDQEIYISPTIELSEEACSAIGN